MSRAPARFAAFAMPHAIERLFATPITSPVLPSSNIVFLRLQLLSTDLTWCYTPPMPNETEELAEIIRKRSLRVGDFVLSSGKKASYYLDCRLTTLHPRGALLIARLLLRKIADLKLQADAIGGMTLGADPIAASVAVLSEIEGHPLPAFIVRKEAK